MITFNLNFNQRNNADIVLNNGQPNKNNAGNEYKPMNSWQNRQNFANITKRKCDDDFSNGCNWKERGWTRNGGNEECDRNKTPPMFKTGLDELEIQYAKKFGNGNGTHQSNGTGRKTLGGRRTVGSPFVPPIVQQQHHQYQSKQIEGDADVDMYDNNDRLKHIDPKMIELIRSEIMNRFASVCMYILVTAHFSP